MLKHRIKVKCEICGKEFEGTLDDYEEIHHDLFEHYLENHKNICNWFDYLKKHTTVNEYAVVDVKILNILGDFIRTVEGEIYEKGYKLENHDLLVQTLMVLDGM